MTKDEIDIMKPLDRFYVTDAIFKMSIRGPAFKVYVPGKFYVVLNIEVRPRPKSQLELFGGMDEKTSVVIMTTTSEYGNNRIFLMRDGKVKPYVKHFHLIDKDTFKEISNVEFFDSI